jgi:iron complex transport system substrate-binding protein
MNKVRGSREDAKARREEGTSREDAKARREEGTSREDAKARRDVEEIATIVVDCALNLHKDLGPGLLESVYETVLARILEHRGLIVERQKLVPICYQGLTFDEGFRLDMLVDRQLIVELKSVETIHPVHPKQLLTYLRLMDLPLGLLINFGAPLLKDGLRRIVNNHSDFTSSCLRVHQTEVSRD